MVCLLKEKGGENENEHARSKEERETAHLSTSWVAHCG